MRHAVNRRLALLAALSALAPPGRAAPPLRALILDTEPFGYRNASGELTGLYVDLVRMLAGEAGRPVQVDLAPVARVVQEINRGTSDFTLLLAYDFDAKVRALGVALQLEVLLLPRRDVPLARPEDLAGRTVVGFKGTPVQQVLPAEVAVHRQYVSSARAMVAMLKAGRADAALSVRETLVSGLRAAGLRGDAADGFGPPLSLGMLDVSLWVRPGLPEAEAQALSRALRRVQQSGELARLRRQYLGDGR
jgi:ABC-type amino acid transport substrate-binding protein